MRLKRPLTRLMLATLAGAALASGQALAGEGAYNTHCAVCHQTDGEGLANVFPPLAGADYFLADKTRAIDIVVHGMTGPVRVSGVLYNSMMPPMSYLSDEDIAHALSYALNAWGNDGGEVTAEQVAARRTEGEPVVGGDE